MENTNISYATAVGAMSLLSDGVATGALDPLGVTKAEWRRVTGTATWTGKERPVVDKVLRSIAFGTMDILGVPRFRCPAEYTAAVIAMYVAPANLMLACSWLGNLEQQTADSMSRGEDEFEVVTARQLFSLVLQLHPSTDAHDARERFEKRTNREIEFVTRAPVQTESEEE